jgi:hypothetical protein
MPSSHVASTYSSFLKPGHRAECSCGWESTSSYPTAELAEAVARDHVRLASPSPDPSTPTERAA